MLETVVRKKGDVCHNGRRDFAPTSRTAEPKPNQPGSMTRACDQENTQGMARKSSMRPDLVRDAGRLPIFKSEISGSGVDSRK